MLLEADKVYNLHYSFILEEVEEPNNNIIHISNKYKSVLEEAILNLNSADTPINTQFIIKLNMSYSEGNALGNTYIPLISLEKTFNRNHKITVLNEDSKEAINQYKQFMNTLK